jgi:hypothetical protein
VLYAKLRVRQNQRFKKAYGMEDFSREFIKGLLGKSLMETVRIGAEKLVKMAVVVE